MSSLLGAPVQVAYVVPDVEQAALRWAAEFGAGPFFINSHIAVSNVVHRGVAAEFDHTSAYGQWGDLMVELVHDHGPGPSVVRERFAPHESGLHHFAYMVDDFDVALAGLAASGYPVAMSAVTLGGTRFAFVDGLASHGHFFEVYQRSDRLLAFYGRVRTASLEWDGVDPVRHL
jgi:hypothetical protein